MEDRGLMKKRIPTILGFVILIAGLVAGVYLVGQQQGFFTKAGPTSVPKNVKITNRGSSTYTVSWTTDVPVTGFVKYSDNPSRLTIPAGDTRDQVTGTSSPYTTHYVDVTGLSADKTYYFEIGSGSTTYNDDGKPYQVRTAVAGVAPTEDVMSGKVLTAAGAGAAGAMVYVELTGSELLSTLTKSDGTFRLALSNARNKQGKFLTYDKTKETISITVQAGANGSATAITNTTTDNPTPEITLGKTHNFVGESLANLPINSLSSTTSSSTKSGSFKVAEETTLVNDAGLEVKLLYPAAEGERVYTTTPEFIGTGPEGRNIALSLNTIPLQTASATPSSNGNWAWSPNGSLDLGFYTLTWEFKNSQGVTTKTSRGFEIASASAGIGGLLPAFTATPTATPTIASPSAEPTPEYVASPTATPMATGSASESGTLEEVGVLTPTIALLMMGIGLFFAGSYWNKKLTTQ